MSYGKTLREAREQRKLTREELARLLSVDPGFIAYLEKDACKPSHTLMLLVSSIFGGIKNE